MLRFLIKEYKGILGIVEKKDAEWFLQSKLLIFPKQLYHYLTSDPAFDWVLKWYDDLPITSQVLMK